MSTPNPSQHLGTPNRHRAHALLHGALLACLTGCGGSPAESPGPAGASPWDRTRLLAQNPEFPQIDREDTLERARRVRLRMEADHALLEVTETLGADALTPSFPGVWTVGPALLRPTSGPRQAPSAPLTVSVDGVDFRPLTHLSEARAAALAGELPEPATFADIDHLLVIHVGGATAPQEVQLRYSLPLGRRTESGWRIALGGLAGDGWLLPPAPGALQLDRSEIAGSAPANSTPAKLALYAASLGEPAAQLPPTSLRLEIDGRDAGRWVLGSARDLTWSNILIQLPGEWDRMRLTAEGPAPIALLDPRWIPAPPSEETRPDVLLFVADTFRADRMSAYAGAPAVIEESPVPRIDAFAERATVFARSWSSAPWTLPSQASMLTGWTPAKHGAISPVRTFADGDHLLSRVFAAAGYRTLAITDGVYLDPSYGFDAGFEFFDARAGSGDVERRLALALEDPDPRPLFAFVQTYQAHTPFEASAEARARLDPQGTLGPNGHPPIAAFDEAQARAEASGSARPLETPEVRARLADLERLYTAGTWDLDQLFDRTLATWDDRRNADRSVVVFTSDHGEAFGEHGYVFHSGALYDEQTRVPLVIRAPGLAPGVRPEATWSLDLAPTLTALAGIAPHPSWIGRELQRAPGDERTLWLHQAHYDDGRDARGAVIDRWKFVRVGAAGSLEIYDLKRDPLELDALELITGGLGERIERFEAEESVQGARSAGAGTSMELGPEARMRLEAMGYVIESPGH